MGSIKDSIGDVNVASNWTHLVQDAISVIADEENHPNPQDCDGVDYQEIYEYILSIMAELRYECYEAKEELKEEMSILGRYTPRGILTWNLDFPECTDMEMNTLCTLGKLNPLKITPT